MTATRRTAREWAIQMLTAADLNPPDDVQAFMAAYWDQVAGLEEEFGGPVEARGRLREFAEERVLGVLGAKDAIDAALSERLDRWELDRLGTVERAVLRMGAWELENTDIPCAVVINESIDLANWFSGPRSRTLVNGVLDRLAKAKGPRLGGES